MTWRRIFGLDPVEFIIYWFVALSAGVFLMEASGMDELIPLTMAVSAVGYAVLRRRAMKHGGAELPGDASALARLQEEQAASADFFERRINELEERLDFTERLLTEQRNHQLAQGQPSSHDRG